MATGVCKPVGATPLEALREYAVASGRPENERRSYAGRLDPMAEGLLVVLEGDECDAQEAWQHHAKEYAWEMVLGVSSDTFDVMGLGRLALPDNWDTAVRVAEQHLSRAVVGKRQQPYPPFSSARVRGHPLFWWALQGRLAEVEIPRIAVEVYSSSVGSVRWLKASQVLQMMLDRIGLVSGAGFRQEAICARWRDIIGSLPEETRFPVISVRTRVSSGTYVRSLAEEAGAVAGCGGLAWSICRVSVGPHMSLLNAFPLRPVRKATFLAVIAILRKRGFIH